MKWLEVFLLSPGWDASSLQPGLPREINLPVPNTPTCTVGEEAPWEQSVSSKNIMHWPKPSLKPGLLGVQCTNQYIAMAMFTLDAWVWFLLALKLWISCIWALDGTCTRVLEYAMFEHNNILCWCPGTMCKHHQQYAAMMSTSRLGLQLSICWREVKPEKLLRTTTYQHDVFFYSNRDSLNCTCKCGLIGGLFSFFAALSSSSTYWYIPYLVKCSTCKV